MEMGPPCFSYLAEILLMSRLFAVLLIGACIAAPAAVVDAQTPYDIPASRYDYDANTSYFRQVDQLDQLIRIRKAEIAMLERQLKEWEGFDRFRNGRPLMTTLDYTRLLLLDAKRDLACLEQQLFDVVHRRGRW